MNFEDELARIDKEQRELDKLKGELYTRAGAIRQKMLAEKNSKKIYNEKLMNEIYSLTGESKKVNVVACSICGGPWIDYEGDSMFSKRKSWRYEVCFEYVLEDGLKVCVNMKDEELYLSTGSVNIETKHVELDLNNPIHHPAVLVQNLLHGDARNYIKLNPKHFINGNASANGSGLSWCGDWYTYKRN
jgi:uncharacterized protein YebE (UPF0316 family)